MLNTILSVQAPTREERLGWADDGPDGAREGIQLVSYFTNSISVNIVTKINKCKRHYFVGACMVRWSRAEGHGEVSAGEAQMLRISLIAFVR